MNLDSLIVLIVFVPIFLILIYFIYRQCRQKTNNIEYSVGDIENPKLSYQHYFLNNQIPPTVFIQQYSEL
jgi:hypothetical protein